MPDIVSLEETGERDFQPRIPFVVVTYEGFVRHLEPIAMTTTCPVRIAYFPFDQQVNKLNSLTSFTIFAVFYYRL